MNELESLTDTLRVLSEQLQGTASELADTRCELLARLNVLTRVHASRITEPVDGSFDELSTAELSTAATTTTTTVSEPTHPQLQLTESESMIEPVTESESGPESAVLQLSCASPGPDQDEEDLLAFLAAPSVPSNTSPSPRSADGLVCAPSPVPGIDARPTLVIPPCDGDDVTSVNDTAETVSPECHPMDVFESLSTSCDLVGFLPDNAGGAGRGKPMHKLMGRPRSASDPETVCAPTPRCASASDSDSPNPRPRKRSAPAVYPCTQPLHPVQQHVSANAALVRLHQARQLQQQWAMQYAAGFAPTSAVPNYWDQFMSGSR